MRAITRPARVAVAKKNLLNLVKDSKRGIAGPPRPVVETAVDNLIDAASGTGPPPPSSLAATWELVYTSEREVLWLIENGGVFGTETGAVYQSLDLAAGTLSNVVTFPPTGAFVVASTAAAVEGGASTSPDALRVEFKFTGARLDAPWGSLPLPPFGQGWFDNVFVDGDLRVARDVRGDTLICTKAGPPRAWPRPGRGD